MFSTAHHELLKNSRRSLPSILPIQMKSIIIHSLVVVSVALAAVIHSLFAFASKNELFDLFSISAIWYCDRPSDMQL